LWDGGMMDGGMMEDEDLMKKSNLVQQKTTTK
jgi:hypothetical protein